MTALITELIDKQDSFEIVRDKIASILVEERNNQMALAAAALPTPKDPALWDFKVYTERSNAWERFLADPTEKTPIVNIMYDTSVFDPSASNKIDRQKSDTTYHIDMYGRGVSSDDGAGHKPGDLEAALVSHRVIRLVRNILMSGQYTYLDLRGLVWGRWPQSIRVFQPEIEGRAATQIVGARLSFEVSFNELSPQVLAETLEFLSVDIKRAEDGEIVAEADFDYTA